jgi:hypothetical protein
MAPFPEDCPEGFTYYRRVNGKTKDVSLLGFYARTRCYRDIADPIVEFILEEHERFLDEICKEPIPLIICSNPACNKLVMPERIGKKKFCSDDCKTANHKGNMPKSERRDYMWLYRLSKREGAPKRKALKSHEGQERFSAIKAEKDYGPACKELIRKLELFT